MPRKSSNVELGSEAHRRAERIRAAVEGEHEPLLRSVAVLVAKARLSLRWPEVMELATELLDEAVKEALQHAERFDLARSATAWVRGIAARLLSSRRRDEARARRCVPATVLGEEGWESALAQLQTGPADEAVARRLDLEQALAQLSPDERRAIELRYSRGLDGEELASVLGAPSTGAARVRVCRALRALKAQFTRSEGEVHP
jgi:RNA polymerase sigma factor (sigma-70 family)